MGTPVDYGFEMELEPKQYLLPAAVNISHRSHFTYTVGADATLSVASWYKPSLALMAFRGRRNHLSIFYCSQIMTAYPTITTFPSLNQLSIIP
jgi:hypothetical protein